MKFFAYRVVSLPTNEFKKWETELFEIIDNDPYLKLRNKVLTQEFFENIDSKLEEIYDVLENFKKKLEQDV